MLELPASTIRMALLICLIGPSIASLNPTLLTYCWSSPSMKELSLRFLCSINRTFLWSSTKIDAIITYLTGLYKRAILPQTDVRRWPITLYACQLAFFYFFLKPRFNDSPLTFEVEILLLVSSLNICLSQIGAWGSTRLLSLEAASKEIQIAALLCRSSSSFCQTLVEFRTFKDCTCFSSKLAILINIIVAKNIDSAPPENDL